MCFLQALGLLNDVVNRLGQQAVAGCVGMDGIAFHVVVTQQLEQNTSLQGNTGFLGDVDIKFR